jgi:hypothetical protein
VINFVSRIVCEGLISKQAGEDDVLIHGTGSAADFFGSTIFEGVVV